MSARTFICATAFVLAALVSPAVEAVLLTGTFTGTANGFKSNPWDGTLTPITSPATGSFAFETSLPDTSGWPDYCCAPPTVGPGSLDYDGTVFEFNVRAFGREVGNQTIGRYWSDSVTMLEEGAQQSFQVRGGGPYWYWSMSFLDPDGGLFRDFNPETFDPRQVDLSRSFAEFSGDIRSYGATISFDTVVFDGYSQAVPEPAPLGLFGAGLLLVALMKRRARS